MKIEIWSDIACPFCYIGKRRIEYALQHLHFANEVNITWRSFELNPDAPKEVSKDIYDMLAEKYGRTREWALGSTQRVGKMAEEVGLHFNFETQKPTNSFNAHRIIQLAKKHGLQDIAEERFFKAYFCEGANVADDETLIKLGEEIGLSKTDIISVLQSDKFAYDVRTDQLEARNFGISGVPFFVIDRKFGISGAQPSEVFIDTLNKAFKEKKPFIFNRN